MKQLLQIQAELKAPKNQFNSFGKYKYRNAEDILEAVKPLLLKYNCTLTLSDQIKETSGGLVYVESTAIISNDDIESIVTAQAGIDPARKGMDIAQSFGSSSSYARKYALSGLFLLDDTKDADATNTHGKDSAPTREEKDKLIIQTEKLPEERRAKAVVAINKAETHDEFIKLKTALDAIKIDKQTA
jgi:hypothetical protein